MCSICGGTSWNYISVDIWEKAKDRGRDDSGKFHQNGCWIGNRRATPTTEVEEPKERQPVGTDVKIVFNGILSNDKDLGIQEGEADTSVLPRILDFSSLEAFRDSIEKNLVGSYAIAALLPDDRIFLACNYKPIWFLHTQRNIYFSSLKHHLEGDPFSGFTPKRMEPYSVLEIRPFPIGFYKSLPIRRTQSNKALVICSGGLDSTTVASIAVKEHGKENVVLLHYDYGCRATDREKTAVKDIASYLGCDYAIQRMPSFGGSSLLDTSLDISKGVAGAEYAHEWVPARNLVMLSLTVAFAEAKEFGHIYLGTNLEEAGAYPDNEEQFILDFNNLLYGAVQNGVKVEIHTPLGGLMKHEIVKLGTQLGTPYHLTWSCYLNGNVHCGECGPCFMRRTAFDRNGLVDPVTFRK